MVNKNYARGKIMDVRCAEDLRKAGYWATPSYASKGIFDVVACKNGLTRFIQVKRSKRNIVSVNAVATQYHEDIIALTEIPIWEGCIQIELWLWIDAQFKDDLIGGVGTGIKHKRTRTQKAGWRTFIINEIGGIMETTV